MNKKIVYFKIALVFLISLALVDILSKNVFISNTPRIRKDIAKNIYQNLKEKITSGADLIASLVGRKKTADSFEAELKDVPLKMMAPGVYGKTKGNISYSFIKEEEVIWVEHRYEIDGKVITIRIPQGQEPLPKEIIADIYK